MGFIWAITENVFMNFLKDYKIEDKNLPLSNIMVIWTGMTMMPGVNSRNPSRCIVRH